MVTTYLVEYPWITTVALVAALAVAPIAGLGLMDRPHLASRLGVASLLPIAALTLVPSDRGLAVGCATEWNFPTLGAVELVANVVLFIPPALLFGVAVRRPLVVLFGASLGAAAIEVAQALLTALGRSCSTNDWLANTLGAALGAAIAAVVIWFRRAQGGAAAVPGHRRR